MIEGGGGGELDLLRPKDLSGRVVWKDVHLQKSILAPVTRSRGSSSGHKEAREKVAIKLSLHG